MFVLPSRVALRRRMPLMLACLAMTQIPGLVMVVAGQRLEAAAWTLYGLASLASSGALFLMGLGCLRRTERIVTLVRGFSESGHLGAKAIQTEGSVAVVEHALENLEGVLRTLEREATRDPLTGSFNRRCGVARLDADLARGARDGAPYSIAVFDLDELKSVNDRLGHMAGDRALRHLAHVLQASVRDGDWVSRWGGDEFLVGFWNADEDAARKAVARVLARLCAEPLEINGERLCLSATVGVAQAGPQEDAARLFERADDTLMELKRRGRRRVGRD